MVFLLIFFTSLILQFFLPWWIIGPIAFAFAFLKAYNSGFAFQCGFYAIFILWIIMGLIKTIPNENILANRVGQMLMLPNWSFNWIIILLVTGLIGGFVGGLAALAGFHVRSMMSSD